MAESFTIRADRQTNGTTFVQTTIDLGAYISAPAKKLLKINSISVQMSDDSGGAGSPIFLAANSSASATWQLTTQSQTTIVDADDKSVISGGNTYFFNSSGTANVLTGIHDTTDRNDQQWTNGYLVATPNIYLCGVMSAAFSSGDLDIIVYMECEVVSATEARVFALSLSQQ